ncbi:MAG: YebC/PmpR family DNA-binding transcriptional regulator [Patescibacteria group bacterium]|nr:YebC/PmpR family DNA-binding transcriptional regulator [Patescibacteria group bacterium]
MSGHSKWSQIKHQKGAADQKRGQLFTKLGRAIAICVKEAGGNGDPNTNFKLRLAIEKARTANMPNINIEKAIRRGQGKEEGLDVEEIMYEGYGPGKAAILVQTATDNRQRTFSNLKNIFTEFGGSLAGRGSVSYLFENKGLIKTDKDNLDSDRILELAIDAGINDYEDLGDTVIFYTEIYELNKVKTVLEKKGLKIIESEIIYKPLANVVINKLDTSKKLLNLISALEDEDDVQKVASNFDIPDNLLHKI